MKFKAFNSLIAVLFVSVISSYAHAQSIEDVVLNVYKEPTCGCCNGWIEHMNDNGYSTAFHHPTNIQKLKDEFGLKNEWRSCHTAVHKDGYYFEGHIPEKFIQSFCSSLGGEWGEINQSSKCLRTDSVGFSRSPPTYSQEGPKVF